MSAEDRQEPARWAFVKTDIPELQPRIMVVIVQALSGTQGEVIDAKVCQDRAEADTYMRGALGPHYQTVWTRVRPPQNSPSDDREDGQDRDPVT